MLNKLTSLARKAIDHYNLISDGDKIAVGLSGGKDSLALATILKHYSRFSKQKFEVVAVVIDLFNGQTDYTELIKYCDGVNLQVHIIKSKIYNIVFNTKQESNPCSLCAKLRRGILNNAAKELGCNKVALGHHMDDVLETFMMSLYYEGRISTFMPSTYLQDCGITVIRPMIYIKEQSLTAFAKNLPVVKNNCPADKKTKREYFKNLLTQIEKENPQAKDRMLTAIIHSERANLFPTIPEFVEKHNNKQLNKKAKKQIQNIEKQKRLKANETFVLPKQNAKQD